MDPKNAEHESATWNQRKDDEQEQGPIHGKNLQDTPSSSSGHGHVPGHSNRDAAAHAKYSLSNWPVKRDFFLDVIGDGRRSHEGRRSVHCADPRSVAPCR